MAGIQKDLNLLTPVVRRKCEQLESESRRLGILIGWTETRRSPLVQRAYYAQGRESLGMVNAKRNDAGLWLIDEPANRRKVTNTLDTVHFYDCAADFHLLIDGKPSWNTKADINEDDIMDYANVGYIAKGLGMTWGGDFKFKDYAHVEYTGGLSREQLRAGMRPEEDVYW